MTTLPEPMPPALPVVSELGDPSIVAPSLGARLRDLYALGKPNLSALVALTGVIGMFLASPSVDGPRLCLLALGLWLTAAGAGGLNMAVERGADAKMVRTRSRPIPAGRLGVGAAALFSSSVFVAGFLLLWVAVEPSSALLALLTMVVYVGVYTPLKRRPGVLSTWVGALPGALPALIGWAAAEGELAPGAYVLFLTLFFWQFPHFLALAFLYREDYRRGGFEMLPVGDAGRFPRTSALMVAGATIVLVASASLTLWLGVTGPLFLVGALVIGLGFLAITLTTLSGMTHARARRVFLGSIAYFPALWLLILADGLVFG